MVEEAAQGANEFQTWLVGAMNDGADQTARFVRDGIWECSQPNSMDRKKIAAMRPGDRIAIKSTFWQRDDLPFDAGGHTVSAMRIKARGTISRVTKQQIIVNWELLDPERIWYLYTALWVVWRLPLHGDHSQKLAAFIFDDEPQDVEWFRNQPYWAERFDKADPTLVVPDGFEWVPFSTDLANMLIEFEARPSELAELVHRINDEVGQSPWNDKFNDGTFGPLKSVDPGTVMSLFNLESTPETRRHKIAAALAEGLGLETEVPTQFEGGPRTPDQNPWLFKYAAEREIGAVKALWRAERHALTAADDDLAEPDPMLEGILDEALRSGGWPVCTALFRMRPMSFCPMDLKSRVALRNTLGVTFPDPGEAGAAHAYLEALAKLRDHLRSDDAVCATIPEFVHLAADIVVDEPAEKEPDPAPEAAAAVEREPYSIDALLEEGCFIPRERLEELVETLRRTKNVILQGPPGTGKTWLARRLGKVLAGFRDGDTVQVVQFHPNTSYEDFVRGYRPHTGSTGAAQLTLVDGPFLRHADRAKSNAGVAHTMVVEEINRGNPARAFGEMLTLIEGTKRSPGDAIRLTYERESDQGGVWLPPNLFLVGTMNIADRSLAMVDLALRRRFAFVTLEPCFNDQWAAWTADFVDDKDAVPAIGAAMDTLNETIAHDPTLGPAFMVGHSFLTPEETVGDARAWFESVVHTSIKPLLEEYWFDRPERAVDAVDELLAEW